MIEFAEETGPYGSPWSFTADCLIKVLLKSIPWLDREAET
jgi:hypothetical protein